MKYVIACALLLFVGNSAASGQTPADGADFALALPSHQDQVYWHAEGFKTIKYSATPDGRDEAG
jgi:hypothetical protein